MTGLFELDRDGHPVLSFHVVSFPVQQGSHKPLRIGKNCRCVPDNPQKLQDWRGEVAKCALAALDGQPGFDRELPLDVRLDFYLKRSSSAPKREYLPVHGLDLDKLQRAVGDALEASTAIANDKQICHFDAWKRFARSPDRPIGVQVTVTVVPEEDA